MAAVPFIDKVGFVSKNLGTAAALAFALGSSEGGSRTGFYGDLTGGAEKIGVVVNAVEIGSFTSTSVLLNKPTVIDGMVSAKAATDASLGAELITNAADRDFSGAGNWTGTNWTVGSGVYTHVAGANVATLAGYAAVVSTRYQITITVTTTTPGTLIISYGGASATAVGQLAGTLASYTVGLTAVSTAGLTLSPNSAWTGSVDNVSIKAVTFATASETLRNAAGVIVSEVRGNATSVGVGVSALASLTTGANNTAIGNSALFANTTGYDNTAIGSLALSANTTGYENIAIGYQALLVNTTGRSNVAVGYQALLANTTGPNNTAIGHTALVANTTGGNNVAVGRGTLVTNTTGSGNSAIGNGALNNNLSGGENIGLGSNALYTNATGSQNIAIGTSALQLNTGSNNTAIGYLALFAKTTGNNNTASGWQAGRYFGSGTSALSVASDSVFIGYDTRAAADSQTNQIVIGASAIGNGSNTATLGHTTITATYLRGIVNVGVVGGTTGTLTLLGSTSGSATIKVAAAAGTPVDLTLPTVSPTAGQFLQSTAAGVLSWATPSSDLTNAVILAPASSARNAIQSTGTAIVGLALKVFSNIHSANLMEWDSRDSVGTPVGYIDSYGRVTAYGVSSTAGVDVGGGNLRLLGGNGIFFDSVGSITSPSSTMSLQVADAAFTLGGGPLVIGSDPYPTIGAAELLRVGGGATLNGDLLAGAVLVRSSAGTTGPDVGVFDHNATSVARIRSMAVDNITTGQLAISLQSGDESSLGGEVARFTGGLLATHKFDLLYTTASTDTITGAFTVAGGVGIAGRTNIAGQTTIGKVGGTTGTLTLLGSTSGSTTIQVAAVAGGAFTLTLPTTAGASGDVLSTNGAGVLSWAAPANANPAGATTEIQYNNAGAFGASSDFTWNNTTKKLTVQSTFVAAEFASTATSLSGGPYNSVGSSSTQTTLINGGTAWTFGSSHGSDNLASLTFGASLSTGTTIANVTGSYATAGVSLDIASGETVTVTEVFGSYSNAALQKLSGAGTATITRLAGARMKAALSLTGGAITVTDLYDIYVPTATIGGGTVGNMYGLYLGTTTLSGTTLSGTKYGIFQDDASATNVFKSKLRFDGSTSGSTTIQVAAVAGGAFTLTLPTTAGASGDVLRTDGAGVLSWITPVGTIGGSIAATQIAYGSGTNTITGEAAFTYTAASDTLTVGTVSAGLGLSGTPSYTFTGDLNTGIFSAAADTLNLVTAGSTRMRFYSDGGIEIGAPGTPVSPGLRRLQFGNGSNDRRGLIYQANSGDSVAGVSDPFVISSSGAGQGGIVIGSTNGSENTSIANLQSGTVTARFYGNGGVQIGGTYAVSPGSSCLRIGSTITGAEATAFSVSGTNATMNVKSTDNTKWSGINMYDHNDVLSASFQYGNPSAPVYADQFFIAARKTTTPIIFSVFGPSVLRNAQFIYPDAGIQMGGAYSTSPGYGNLRIFGTQDTPSNLAPLIVSAAGLPAAFSTMTETTAIIVGANGQRSRLMLDCYKNSGSTSVAPILTFRSANGTAAATTAVRSSDLLANLSLQAFDGTDYNTASKGFVTAWAASQWTNTSHPFYVDIATTDTNATDVGLTRLRVWQDGGVQIGGTYSTSPGVGNLYVRGTASSTNTATGSIVASGGFGLTGDINCGATITASGLIKTTGSRFAGGAGDVALIPRAGEQSVVAGYWGLQLLGNVQSSVESINPSNVNAKDYASVVAQNQQPASVCLLITGHATQTANLQEWQNSAGTVLASIGSAGNLRIASSFFDQGGMAAPALSASGDGRIYFDSTANRFKISENGGAYFELGGGPAGSSDQIQFNNSGLFAADAGITVPLVGGARRFSVVQASTSTVTNDGGLFEFTWNPASAVTGDQYFSALRGVANIDATTANSGTARYIGVEGRAYMSGSTVPNVHTMAGVVAHAIAGAGSGSGTITNLYQFVAGGITSLGLNSLVTNSYGLFLGTITIGPNGGITNRWGVYQADPNATSYFAGKVQSDVDAYFNGVRIGLGGGNITTNTVVGNLALDDNTTGFDNTVVGYTACQYASVGNRNTVVGHTASQIQTSGDNNCSFGFKAGYNRGSGSFDFLLSADNSVFIGAGSRPADNAQTNQIVIGYEALGNGSNTVTLGNTSITSTYLQGIVSTPGTFYAVTDVLTDAATINYAASDSDNFTLLLTSAVGSTRVLAAPTALVSGMRWVIRVKQPASGGPCNLTYNAAYKFVNGYTPVLTTAANAIDVISCYYDGTDILTQVTQSYGTAASLDVTGASLAITGAVNFPTTTVSTSTSLNATHHTVLVDASAGPVVITIPDTATSGVPGRIYHIKKIDSSVNAVTIQRSGSDLIDGVTAWAMTTQYQNYTVHARTTGTVWDII